MWQVFLLNPFFTFLYVMKNRKVSVMRNVIWAFIVFYGVTFAIGPESADSDINRHIESVKDYHHESMTFEKGWNQYVRSPEIDVLTLFLKIAISRFTENGHLLLILYCIIFGYFFSNNICISFKHISENHKISYFVTVLLTCLFFAAPIEEINGLRFITATHVFLYGLLRFFLFKREKRYLFWCLLAPLLFHFSLIFPLFILGLYLLLGNKIRLYFVIFIISLFITSLPIKIFNSVFDAYAPDILKKRTASYRMEKAVDEYRSKYLEGKNQNWYATFYKTGLKWSLISYLILFYFRKFKLIKKFSIYSSIYSFVLLLFAFTNVLLYVPGGIRFLLLTFFLSLFISIIIFNNIKNDKILKLSKEITFPFLLLFILVSIRSSLYNLSLTCVLGNPFFAIFTIGETISINFIMKEILL